MEARALDVRRETFKHINSVPRLLFQDLHQQRGQMIVEVGVGTIRGLRQECLGSVDLDVLRDGVTSLHRRLLCGSCVRERVSVCVCVSERVRV